MADVRTAFASFLRRRPAAAPVLTAGADHAREPFSSFNPEHMSRMGGLMLDFGGIMREAATPEAGAEAVLARAEAAAGTGSLGLAQHARGIFAVHAGKSFPGAPRLPVPPLVFKQSADRSEAAEPDLLSPALDEPTGEDLLHWWREDLFLNEHHRHWHLVYSTVGVPDGGVLRLKSRQGEIFVYMHRQMLARYDTERVAAGLARVEPLGDPAASLGAGYDPNAREPANIGYAPRPADQRLPPADAADIDRRRAEFRKVLSDGRIFGRPVSLSVDLVGSVLESNLSLFGPVIRTQQELDSRLAAVSGSYQMHNVGHGMLAAVPSAGNRVMNNPHTSLKDPVFWRWHRMIDDLAEELSATLPPHQPDLAAGITLRKPGGADSPDVLLVSETRLRAAGVDLDSPGRDAAVAAYAESRFGAGRWDAPVDPADVSAELRTGMLRDTFVYEREVFDSQGNATARLLNFQRQHLISERCLFVVRAENASAAERLATLRIFVCADAFLDLTPGRGEPAVRSREHRFWIEMERTPVTLQPGHNVLTRITDQSSVVRKLNGRAPWPTSAFTEADFGDLMLGRDSEDDYCDCGWPLNLHVPKGTVQGMGFHLMAMVSPGAPGSGPGACGSRAFCGAGFDRYPELPGINMGYPFDRPATDGTLAMIAAAPNMALRRIRIRHDPALAAELGLTVEA